VLIAGLVKDPLDPSARHRLAALSPWLEAGGHRLEIAAWPPATLERIRRIRSVRRADLVVIQRRLLPRWALELLRRAARRLVFDFDDAIHRPDSSSEKDRSAVRLRRFAATVRAADVVVAGNDSLRAEAARLADSSRLRVIPTCIEPARYTAARHARRGGAVELAWIGSRSTLEGLERAAPIIDAVGRAVPGIALKVICDRFPRFRDMPVREVRWSAEDETAELAAADVGVSWLPDDAWSRGKCGLKVLQYMAAGLPVVANPVGVQAAMVLPGETGFLASSPEEWTAAVRRLADDPDLRRRMGAAARRRVETEWSTERAAGLWVEILRSLSGGVEA
jgi:glycosyltransferase involved in cell wall biosynthesis